MTVAKELTAAIEWAEERLRNGAEPPFIYYRLMQLREAAQELLPHAKRLEASCTQSEGRPESDLRSAGSVVQLSSAQRHLDRFD